MQVLAFNSSPRRDKGGTAAILTPFLEGMKDAGANVELIYVRDLEIGPCRGCYTCWTKSPGKCVQKDDMVEILPKLASADIVVFATPVYVDGMTSTMKALMDRSIPLIKGVWEIRDDHCRHPRRDTKEGKIILVSASGFTELDNFDPLITHMKAACKNLDRDFIGAVVRPYSWALSMLEQQGVDIGNVLRAAKEAGGQAVKEGKISSKTLSTISRELITRDELIKHLNPYYEQFEN
ncbi:MAG: flavodoxin family protein [Candidatus Hodarchaeales archaeon]|jgi:multimeric flavodoxin WrbA